MNIILIQQTKEQMFVPVEGWQKNEDSNYNNVEKEIVQEVQSKIHPDITVEYNFTRYFKFTIKHKSKDGNSTMTDEIIQAVQVLKDVCAEFALEYIGEE